MGLIVRLLLIAGGAIAGLFIAKDTWNYPIMQMTFALLLLAALIAAIAFRKEIGEFFSKDTGNTPPEDKIQ